MSEKKSIDQSKCVQYHYKLSDDIRITREAEYIILITEDVRRFYVKFSDAALEEVNNLKEEGKTSSVLLDGQSLTNNSSNIKQSPVFITLLMRGLLSVGIKVNGEIIITFKSSKPLSKLIAPINDSAFFDLPPNCWIKPLNGNFILQDASQSYQLIFHDISYVRIISELSNNGTINSLNDSLGHDFTCAIPLIMELMLCANIIQHSSNIKDRRSEASLYEQYWGFEDLLLHERSRWGPHNKFIGANFPLEATQPPPSVTPNIKFTKSISLFKPNKNLIGPSFFDVILRRKSYHEFGKQPISLEQVSLLLWFVLHIKSRVKVKSTGKHQTVYEITKRPVPSGGGLHEIEIFLTINRCDDIESGLYHYNAAEHSLEMIKCRDQSCLQLLSDAACAARLAKYPDILITLTCRYERLAWKYQGIVYSLILKHVGIIFQQLYLVSTALGLAACALGVGNSRTFKHAAMNDPISEMGHSVGEFVIGSKPDPKNS